MTIYVFTGPTLSPEDAAGELEATYLPPASQGDVYATARERPWGIGIIDGYFEHVPAVWHKEILWAMAQGVHVFGSASMGALRAAELAAFGMEGVGRIFEAFHSLELEDDDEVAVVHGGPETGYRTGSEALVNIRATLTDALRSTTVAPETGEALIRIAKETFYPDRSYASLLKIARESGLPGEQLDALEAWLPHGRRDQKRDDAIEMLRTMRAQCEAQRPEKRVRYTFQHTDAWEQVRRQIVGRTPSTSAHDDGDRDEAVIDELRLEGPAYLSAREQALLHALAQEAVDSGQEEVDGALLPPILEEFRRRHGLLEPGAVEPWLEREGLGVDAFERLLREELRTRRVRAIYDAEMDRVLVRRLRMDGRYASLADRARRKQRELKARGRGNPGLEEAGVSESALWTWYFREQLGMQAVPDPSVYARGLGYPDLASLRRAVLREWCFLHPDAREPNAD